MRNARNGINFPELHRKREGVEFLHEGGKVLVSIDGAIRHRAESEAAAKAWAWDNLRRTL